jgi:uncharacterized membrane protein YccF (DUF307 family)
MSSSATEVRTREMMQIPLILRVLWFLLVGWHVTLDWIVIAWLLNVTIIGMPLGLCMLDRVPQVLTLRPMRGTTVSELQDGTVIRTRHEGVPQRSWVLRLPYFLLIGWWFSLLWSLLAWAFCASIIGLPIGIPMLHALPAVTTLHSG